MTTMIESGLRDGGMRVARRKVSAEMVRWAERVGGELLAMSGRPPGKSGRIDPAALYRKVQRVVLQRLVADAAMDRGIGSARLRGLSLWSGANDRSSPSEATEATVESTRTEGIGGVYETLLSMHPSCDVKAGFRLKTGPGHSRKAAGSYYTPARIVEQMLDLVLTPALREAERRDGERGILNLRVCDPSCGTGNFLIAAAHRMAFHLARVRAEDSSPEESLVQACRREVIGQCIFGVDLDPLAVEACRALLWLESDGGSSRSLERHIACGDALSLEWPRAFGRSGPESEGFDVVVGNPPFLNQLETATTHDRTRAAAMRAKFGEAAGAYTDPAGLFLLLGTQIAGAGGRIALIQPQSLLAARDQAGVRRGVLERSSLEALWVAGERVFDAGVLVCVPLLRKGGTRRGAVRRFRGAVFERLPAARVDSDALAKAATWGPLAAAAAGVPEVNTQTDRTLCDIATATADFRDQFYGLRGCVVEDSDVSPQRRARFPVLITTGLIDPAAIRWGQRPTRFAGDLYTAPRVDLSRLRDETSLGRWAQSRLTPKILLATQTRVLEAVADPHGECLPAVPVVTIVPRDRERIWHIAAVLLSPVASAWAAGHYGGSGLSATAIKLSAKQSLGIPIPRPSGRQAWDRAAKLVASAHGESSDPRRGQLLATAAVEMGKAYGLSREDDRAVLEWWNRCRTARRSPNGLASGAEAR